MVSFVIDETIDIFHANLLFCNFKEPADRLLIILILYISDYLAKIGSACIVLATQIEAPSKMLNTLSVDSFAIPGDAGFPLNAHYAAPASRADAGMCN